MVGMTKLTERSCDWCGAMFTPTRSTGRFCSRNCTNTWQRSLKPPTICPCGNEVGKAPGKATKSGVKKYCSPECVSKYQPRRQANPDNYVTFNCLNCDKEVTRYKNYGKGHNKYCSNPCAQKHTKVKKHYAMSDFELVFDSSYEAFFYGACKIAKIPIERFNRQYAVEWKSGQFYAPDFWLPNHDLSVELKGVEDEHDWDRWKVFEAQKPAPKLWVLYYEELLQLSPEQLAYKVARGEIAAVVKP